MAFEGNYLNGLVRTKCVLKSVSPAPTTSDLTEPSGPLRYPRRCDADSSRQEANW
jgi:hypothetical protein